MRPPGYRMKYHQQNVGVYAPVYAPTYNIHGAHHAVMYDDFDMGPPPGHMGTGSYWARSGGLVGNTLSFLLGKK
ncbi:hypothetical protein WR25_11326 [Diploscapter pachys]|uniref:Uncharacterized protein n=1 Tax=Diploscapter pachys TaxID=2018661 RepID=A0A2A2JIG8_9BILA|nr:hypothetical protein WR25_11326 [Diploscapter pachys]